MIVIEKDSISPWFLSTVRYSSAGGRLPDYQRYRGGPGTFVEDAPIKDIKYHFRLQKWKGTSFQAGRVEVTDRSDSSIFQRHRKALLFECDQGRPKSLSSEKSGFNRESLKPIESSEFGEISCGTTQNEWVLDSPPVED
jgi:hypothetical protein